MLGYRSTSGGNGARELAALVQYDLLDRRGKSYTLSAFGRFVRGLKPEDPSWQTAMRDAMGRPAIFGELLERARKEGQIPQDLPRVLVEDFGITAKASPTVAKIFRDSGLVAGVLEPDGTLKSNQVSSKVTPIPRRSSEALTTQADSRRAAEPPSLDRNDTQETLPGETREWNWSLPLDTGVGQLIIRLPEPISETDMPTFQKYMNFYLKMIIEDTRKLPRNSRSHTADVRG